MKSKFLILNADPNDWKKPFYEDPSGRPSLGELLSYASAGYHTGRKWNGNYRPGGPYVRGGFGSRRERDLLCSKAWFSGFDEGLKDKGLGLSHEERKP